MEHRYSLDKSSKKFICPGCGKKCFVCYVDNETGEYLPDKVGRCDREINCKYHYKPKQYFEDNKYLLPTKNYKQTVAFEKNQQKIKEPSLITYDIVVKSINQKGHCKRNNFVQYLLALFPDEVVKELCLQFIIGTSKHWEGATVFYQIDTKERFRTGKIMLYDHNTGKRIKEPYNHINWVHTVLKLDNYNLKQCLFGVHQLLTEPENKMVAIVESEKTAIIMTGIFTNYIWLACGSVGNLNPDKCKVLKERKIILYPDLNCFDKWNEKSKELSKIGFNVVTSDLLESKATETDKENGLDIADYFIKQLQVKPLSQIQKELSEDDKNFNLMLKKNSYLLKFVENFDLVNSNTGKPFEIMN